MAFMFLAFTTAVSTMAELLKRKRPQPNSREGSADSPILMNSVSSQSACTYLYTVKINGRAA